MAQDVHVCDNHAHDFSLQSDDGILARVWHHAVAVPAIALCSWDQGNQPGHL